METGGHRPLEFITGKTVVLDVRTTNVLCASAVGAASPATHLNGLERAKSAKYADYYRAFRPFVIDLSGAVSETSDGALKLIAREAARASLPRLQWEAFDWAVRMQRRIAVGDGAMRGMDRDALASARGGAREPR